MDIAGVREVLHRNPFEPFLIRLADGRALPVPHPDFVALTPCRVIVGAEDDSWSVIEPLLIASLDSITKRPKGGKRLARQEAQVLTAAGRALQKARGALVAGSSTSGAGGGKA